MPTSTEESNDIPPPLYFKILLKEVRERGKICELVSQFIEDVASAEEAFGKSLVKVSLLYNIIISSHPLHNNIPINVFSS